MPRFRKKPVEIEAWRNIEGSAMPDWLLAHCFGTAGRGISIQTLEGTMLARPGDWVIRGADGEVYPCKPEIFEVIYEEVR